MPMPDRPKPGLPAIYEGRAQRERGKYSRATPALAIAGVVGVALVLTAYSVVSSRQLEADKTALLAGQRAVDATVGAEWRPLRDRLEKMTIEAAAPAWMGDFVDSGASSWDFRSLPGIYLRLRVDDARSGESIRKASRDSLKDAFVGCLLREPNGGGARAEDAGPFAEQPWNMRQAYASTRILTPEWVQEVQIADDEKRLRVFDQQYQKAVHEEIPAAIDLIKRAQFFLLVLDEDTPEATARADGGPITPELLQLVAHDARVRIVNLRTGGDVARLRGRASGGFIPAGDRAVADPLIVDAQQRQVNNCSLALQVSRAIGWKR